MLPQINKKTDPRFYRPFLWFLIIAAIVLVFLLFRPFLAEIIIAAILASVVYNLYDKLRIKLWKKKYLAAFLICLALLLIVIIPLVTLISYGAKEAPQAYRTLSTTISQIDLSGDGILSHFNIIEENEEAIKGFILDTTKKITDWSVSGATVFVKNTTSFLISLLIVIITTFFFLVNGKQIVKQLIFWSPLPNKYDLALVETFRSVSYNNLLSLGVAALVQGLLSALGFLVIGWPFFFIFIISAFLSIIPYMLGLFYIPIIIYLLASGHIWQGIFVIIWNLIIVVNIDELIRAYIVKGKSKINTAFVLFAILGGISLFGFWGIFIGPMVLALVITIFHIYELEFAGHLDK